MCAVRASGTAIAHCIDTHAGVVRDREPSRGRVQKAMAKVGDDEYNSEPVPTLLSGQLTVAVRAPRSVQTNTRLL